MSELLHNRRTSWRRVTIEGWYGRSTRRLDIASGTALWHHPGRRVAIRWVLVRDPNGQREPQAFLCTDQAADPADILRWFVRRWRTWKGGGFLPHRGRLSAGAGWPAVD